MSSWLTKFITSPDQKKSKRKKDDTTRKGSQKQSGSSGVNDTEAWKCGECKQTFEENAQLVECYMCERHYCADCLLLNDEGYEILGRPDIFFFCHICHSKAKSCFNYKKDTERRVDGLIKAMGNRIANLEKSLKENINKLVEEVPDKINTANKDWAETELKTKWSDLLKNNKAGNPQTLDNLRQIMKESRAEQRKEEHVCLSRENNLIIYRVDESDKQTAEERTSDDQGFVDELVQDILCIPDTRIAKVVRIGPKLGQDGEPRQTSRPLKVELVDKESKASVMRNLFKLGSAEERFSKISVTQNYSKEEREVIKVKVTEANKMNEEEKTKNFTYRVRGPPWDLRIVKVKKNNQD